MTVRFLGAARKEMTAAIRYYESQLPGLGQRFLSQVEKTIDEIIAHPQAGAPLRRDIRRRLVRSFPFALLYSDLPKEILVIAVMDLRRDPDYWKNRL